MLLSGTTAADAEAASKTICVHRAAASCTQTQPSTGTLGDQLQAAIDVAEANPGSDSILLGDGTYDRGAAFAYTFGDGSLLVQGTGAANVTLANSATTPGQNTFLGAATSGSVTLRDLTIRPAATSNAVGAQLLTEGSRVADVHVATPVSGTAFTGIAGSGLSIEDVTIDDAYLGIDGGGSQLSVNGSTIHAHATAISTRAATTTIRRTLASSSGGNGQALWTTGGNTTVENSVLDATSTDPAANNQAAAATCGSSPPTTTTMTLRFTTVRSAALYGAYASCATAGATASLAVRDSVLAPGTGVRAIGANATVAIRDSRWDGSGVGAVTAGPGLRIDDPRFVSATDLRLQPGSPLVDATTTVGGPLTEPNLGDLTGAPRAADGDGDGVAAADLGAYELQPAIVPLPADNLLANPGAESGPAATEQTSAPLPTGWARTAGTLTQATYGGAFFPLPNVGAAFGSGAQFFAGGPGATLSTAEQTASLQANATAIDAGRVTAALTGLLGGYADEHDQASVTATFLDGNGQPVGTPLTIGPPSADAFGASVTLIRRSTTGAVPVGSRAVRTVLRAERSPDGDSYDDATFDDLALTTSTAPAPPGGPGPPGGTPPGGTPPGGTPPGGTPPPAAYRGVTLTAGRIRLDAKRRIAIGVACPAAAVTRCTGTIDLLLTTGKGRKKKTARLGRAKATVAAGRKTTVRIALAKKTARLVHAKGLAVSVRATTRDARPRAADRTTTAKAKLLPAKRRTKH